MAAPSSSVKNLANAEEEEVNVDAQTHATRHLAGCYVMCSAIVWTGMHWGFVSFSATVLNSEKGENLSFTQIGSFVPTFGVVYVIFTGLIGLIADKWNQKLLLSTSLLLIALGHLAFITAEYFLMLAGFAIIGIGYSTWTIVPYIQIRILTGRNADRYDKWFIAIQFLFMISFSLGRLMMMVTTTVLDEGDWFVWRLPWLISIGMLGLHWVLLTTLGYYPQPLSRETKEDVIKERMTYLEKIKSFYLNPVSFLMLLGCIFSAFVFGCIAAWAPAIATERFDKSKGTINITIALAVLAAWPLGMILITFAIKRARNIKNAARICCWFVLAATGAMIGYSIAKDDFIVHVAMLVLFAGASNFPYVFFKQLPEVLGFPPEVKVFALSRFTLIYSLFSNIVSVFLFGVWIDEFGVSDSLTILVVVSVVGCIFWIIPAVWSYSDSGPIHERHLEQLAEEKAIKNWALLKSALWKKAKTARLLADGMYMGQGSAVLGWLLHEKMNGTPTEHVEMEEQDQA